MSKQKEQWYVSSQPGYCISLPDGMEIEVKAGGVTRRTSVLKFPAAGGKMFKTDNPDVIKFIESCSAFRMGKVTRVPTPEEVAAASKKREQEARLALYHGLLEKGLPLPFKEMSDTNLRKVADEIGADTSKNGKRLTQAAILVNVNKLLKVSE